MDTAVDTSIDPHGADDTGDIVVNPALVAAAKPTAPPTVNVTDDGNQVTVGDKKYVREEALHNERRTRQEYQQTLDTLKPLMPEFEQFLQARRQTNDATVQRATQTNDSTYTPDELAGAAITLGFYDADNKPDTNRARHMLQIMDAAADRRVGRAIQPLRETTTADRAQANVARVMSQQFVDGQPIAEERYLKAAFDALPAEQKADPNVANIIAVVAAGLQSLDERRTGKTRQRREPMFREGSGGSFTGGGEGLDALGRAAARARGKTEEQWGKMTKAVGGTNFGGDVLEEV